MCGEVDMPWGVKQKYSLPRELTLNWEDKIFRYTHTKSDTLRRSFVKYPADTQISCICGRVFLSFLYKELIKEEVQFAWYDLFLVNPWWLPALPTSLDTLTMYI